MIKHTPLIAAVIAAFSVAACGSDGPPDGISLQVMVGGRFLPPIGEGFASVDLTTDFTLRVTPTYSSQEMTDVKAGPLGSPVPLEYDYDPDSGEPDYENWYGSVPGFFDAYELSATVNGVVYSGQLTTGSGWPAPSTPPDFPPGPLTWTPANGPGAPTTNPWSVDIAVHLVPTKEGDPPEMTTFKALGEDDGVEALTSEAFPKTGLYDVYFARHGEFDIEMNPSVPNHSAVVDLYQMERVQASISQ